MLPPSPRAVERLRQHLQRARSRHEGGAHIVVRRVTSHHARFADALRAQVADSSPFVRSDGGVSPLYCLLYDGDVAPADSTPVWEASSAPGVVETLSGSDLNMVDDSDTEYLYWSASCSDAFSASRGVTVDARLKVTSDSGDQGDGFVVVVQDGTYVYVLRVRQDAVEIIEDEVASARASMSDWRRLRFVCQNSSCKVWLGDWVVLNGVASASAPADVDSKVRFGTGYGADPGHGTATASLDWLRVQGRAL